MSEEPAADNLRAEQLLGLAENIRFEDALAQKLAEEGAHPYNRPDRQELLEANSVTVDAAAAPDRYELERLTPTDWEVVRQSPQPLLTLYAASNYQREAAETTFVPVGRQSPKHNDPRVGYEGLYNRAVMDTAPLIHGLSAAAFVRLAESGGMHSNKTRYTQSGEDALTFHSAGVGATNLSDRSMGLDQYVFFDHGRPANNHRRQAEITLVVDPSAAQQENAFMTTRDIADTTSATEYARSLTTPAYFEKTALLRIHNTVIEQGETRSGGHYTGYSIYNSLAKWSRGQDGDFDNYRQPHFSTYEVKVPDPPGVPTAAIRKVVVRDQATYAHLQETMGDHFTFVHEPHLRAAGGRNTDYEGDSSDPQAINKGNYPETFDVPGTVEQRMAELIDTDFQERSAFLDGLPDTEKVQSLVVFGKSDPSVIDSDDVHTRIDGRTNPYQYNGTVAEYTDMQGIYDDIKNTYGMNDFVSASGNLPWFHDPLFGGETSIDTPSGKCVIATIERSKRYPRMTKIVGLQDFSLDMVPATSGQQ